MPLRIKHQSGNEVTGKMVAKLLCYSWFGLSKEMTGNLLDPYWSLNSYLKPCSYCTNWIKLNWTGQGSDSAQSSLVHCERRSCYSHNQTPSALCGLELAATEVDHSTLENLAVETDQPGYIQHSLSFSASQYFERTPEQSHSTEIHTMSY